MSPEKKKPDETGAGITTDVKGETDEKNAGRVEAEGLVTRSKGDSGEVEKTVHKAPEKAGQDVPANKPEGSITIQLHGGGYDGRNWVISQAQSNEKEVVIGDGWTYRAGNDGITYHFVEQPPEPEGE